METPNSLNYDTRQKKALLRSQEFIKNRAKIAAYEKLLGSVEKEPTGELESMTGSRAHILNLDLRVDYFEAVREAREKGKSLEARLAFWKRATKKRLAEIEKAKEKAKA